MKSNGYCDGVRRRDFLKIGALGGAGLSLASYLRLANAGATERAKATSAIFIQLGGGPSHIDTFDPKPEAPSEIRGEFKPIATRSPGVFLSECLPKLAACSDKFAILRGVSHNLAAHEFGTKYMLTGNRPLPSLEYPCIGSVVAKEKPVEPELPPFVVIPNAPQTPGFLGIQYAPLNTGATPQPGKPFSVRGISLGKDLTVTGLERRQRLLDDIDTAFAGYEANDDLLRGLDRFSEQAYRIISSPAAREAFAIEKEAPAIAKRFGSHNFGQSCMLACRLVEAGVRFATVSFGGWDTHVDNFNRLRTINLPQLDEGISALLLTLAERGLLESTAVFVTGEFGRTPKINKNAGRDHWPRAMFVLLAGGGFRSGVALGASDPRGEGPKEKAHTPDDIAASFYHALGVDFRKEYHTNTGRPVMIVRDGHVIQELFG